MKAKSRQSGLTLTEMVVVIAIIALLVGLGVPAGRAFLNSFETESGAKSMISAALASARAVAAKEQRYAGIRFQQDLDDNQYMVFIIQDPEIGAYFFRAVEGLKPIKLPDSVGVMDFMIADTRNHLNPPSSTAYRLDDSSLTDSERNDLINQPLEVADTTTFSILFAPSGRLVMHGIRLRRSRSQDDIFNTMSSVDVGVGMFYQDDYFGGFFPPNLGYGPEVSRRSFIIYDKIQFDETNVNRRWSDYLRYLDVIYINHYTGTIIER